jgi:hypothetical protein
VYVRAPAGQISGLRISTSTRALKRFSVPGVGRLTKERRLTDASALESLPLLAETWRVGSRRLANGAKPSRPVLKDLRTGMSTTLCLCSRWPRVIPI